MEINCFPVGRRINTYNLLFLSTVRFCRAEEQPRQVTSTPSLPNLAALSLLTLSSEDRWLVYKPQDGFGLPSHPAPRPALRG